jgi:hypothetical protein
MKRHRCSVSFGDHGSAERGVAGLTDHDRPEAYPVRAGDIDYSKFCTKSRLPL